MSLRLESQSGARIRDLRLSKQTASTTAPERGGGGVGAAEKSRITRQSPLGEGRAKGPLNVSMIFKDNFHTILKPMTVLCKVHAM